MFIDFKFHEQEKIAFGNSDEAYPIAYKHIFKIKNWNATVFTNTLKTVLDAMILRKMNAIF